VQATIAEAQRRALCDLETYLCPRTVLRKRQEQRGPVVQLESGAGEEQHTCTGDNYGPMSRSRRRCLLKPLAQGS
jgi:hypothetical protein